VVQEEAVHIRVTGKQLSVAIVALVTALGSYPVVNWFNPAVRADSFTGTDGDKLEDRIETIELEVSNCQRRGYLHNEKQAEEVATLKAGQKANEYLIKQCMRITGQ